MGRAASLLSRRRWATFAVVFACVIGWYLAAPHMRSPGLWANVAIVSFGVMPVVLSLVLILLPLRRLETRSLVGTTVAFALLALAFAELDLGLEGNFAKLFAAVFAGWAFLGLFELLSWVVLVALVVPAVDAISVWRGPTHAITKHHLEVYTAVAVAFVVPGGGAAYLGPPDILFYALFLGAADRWGLRVNWTWAAMTGMYGLTVVVANAAHVGGLPALPFLSAGFLAANADILWRQYRKPKEPQPSA
ncbi:MAG TPA: hypothetical protein VMT74_13710 [Gaiellaceae bacterium]|nr:hypothetical protein [Gaiellaceae bacterium]